MTHPSVVLHAEWQSSWLHPSSHEAMLSRLVSSGRWERNNIAGRSDSSHCRRCYGALKIPNWSFDYSFFLQIFVQIDKYKKTCLKVFWWQLTTKNTLISSEHVIIYPSSRFLLRQLCSCPWFEHPWWFCLYFSNFMILLSCFWNKVAVYPIPWSSLNGIKL